ncbi:MAG: enoyl-CoA hydratase/isomerase family protein [Alphaproteobacteria bacterium]|nr:enoyl-CoA hydratase/isomerase family protein [Alphaproteobacteria bacterium]
MQTKCTRRQAVASRQIIGTMGGATSGAGMTNPLPIISEIKGRIGLITLNRPGALNALDTVMIEQITSALDAWRMHDEVCAVVIHHKEGRAYCAGGDVRALWELRTQYPENRDTNDYYTATYFRTEYQLNHKIRFYPKPVVAIIDGMTFGGGVGISVHSSFCVATENTQWAMPETAIGFVPDIGASYVLSRLPGHAGIWLALTGARLGAGDCAQLGIASHIVPAAQKAALIADLAAADLYKDAPGTIDTLLRTYGAPPGLAPYEAVRAMVDDAFSQPTVEAIMERLARHGAWGQEQLALLARMSPASLKVVLRQINEAKALSFNDCLKREYRLGQARLADHDFFEGVRAVLVDKDRKPKWQPATVPDVTQDIVDRHFDPRWDTPNGALELPAELDHA